ncbi:hypothetical protein GCM10022225_38970 [Plantactinospora mayteni]|uniref:Uncharacterized protein n=1 Tax=Plantactinospora mayteni TaxID=566021 RepID=A0ABQ4EWR0_9ACTN|nr:hypothetical protein Pma05_56570 [Plantactinospora mayteni]
MSSASTSAAPDNPESSPPPAAWLAEPLLLKGVRVAEPLPRGGSGSDREEDGFIRAL